jgi:hypothetical protein
VAAAGHCPDGAVFCGGGITAPAAARRTRKLKCKSFPAFAWRAKADADDTSLIAAFFAAFLHRNAEQKKNCRR